jgi:hypothetical protein
MLLDVIEVKAIGGYRLYLKFEDGVEGEIDFSELAPFDGVYAPLKAPAYFAQVRVNPEWGTICWPNDADADPMVLYAKVTGRPEVLKSGRDDAVKV